MLPFPQTTEFNKKIPKQKFYENIPINPNLRRIFIEQIKAIYWKNKLASSTLNIAQGEYITEIEVIEIKLSNPSLDESVLKQIDGCIPYPILFILTCNDKMQAWMGYKDIANDDHKSLNVHAYYHTHWMTENAFNLNIDGLNIDIVYESLIQQIAEMQGLPYHAEMSIAENVSRIAQHEKLKKQISTLENKMHREKQLNRQMEMNAQLKQLREQLSCLSCFNRATRFKNVEN